jgi:hypothetical protein
MTVQTTIAGADDYALQAAISAYSDEAYTAARKISSTGIMGSNPLIDKNTETFTGQLRWRKPINQVVNTASITDATDGELSSYGTEFLNYVKTVRTHGARNINMKDLITQDDGLAKFGRDLAETRSQDEHNAVLSILKGVAISELLNGAHNASGAAGLGGQTFENDPTDKRYGFYVDLGASKIITDAAAANLGAQRATGFLNAFGMAFKDYEPEYAYLFASPAVMASLRSANLVDADRVVDGNVEFNTIFQGKFRLIQTRANQSLTAAQIAKINTGTGVDLVGTQCSFIVLPSAIAMENLNVPLPTEIDRNAGAYKGGGTTTVWHRWGYVLHPAGYSWTGEQEDFPTDAAYSSVMAAGVQTPLIDAADALANTSGVWTRKTSSALSLGILPVFHS